MPLAAIPAVIGASIIGGGASIAGGLLSKNKQSDAQKQQTQLQNDLLKQQQQGAQFALGQAQSLLPQSQGLYNKAIDYYSPLLSGDRKATFEATAPERLQLGRDYNANLKALQFAPRGGGRGAAMQDVDAQQQSQIANLLFSLRPQAAQNLSAIAGQLGAEGTALYGAASGTNASSINSLTNIGGLNLAQKQQDATSSQALGGALFQLFTSLLKAKGGSSGSLPSFSGLGGAASGANFGGG